MPEKSAAARFLKEKVPLLRPWKDPNGQAWDHRNSWTVFFGWLKHTLLHAFMFMVVSILFMVGYHQNPGILTGIWAFLILAILSDALYAYVRRGRMTKEALGFAVLALAIFAGGVVGTSIHLTKLIDYWPYYQKRHYTNVAPDEPAASHSDASVIVFMEGGRPDASRATGYKRYNSIYCVAPIALEPGYSDEEAVNSDIQYWAVGKDCCMGHKGFICDDAENPSARSGLVMSEKTGEDRLMEGVMSNNDMHYYEEAVLMTQSKFDLTSPSTRMYVRFVQDIDKARSAYWRDAWWSWTKYQFVWLLVWMVVGVMTIVIGAGDPTDVNRYNEHIVDAKQSVLSNINNYI